uniref:Rab3 GTPase-activating protein catalytic subunit n=1 Tax=Glossina brevipalpis TaxID=37001 RepID=A0A1A9WMC7_9MUSC
MIMMVVLMAFEVSLGFPDTKTCLLHQKLQMLNVCIERRLEREFKAHRQTKDYIPENDLNLSDSLNDEDEFYDCLDHEERETAGDAENVLLSKCTETEKVANKPEGRLKRLGNLKLLDADEYLYIPITQELVPKTEDQFLDDSEDILNLGSSSDVVRQKMSSSLQSDMDAFKAANPLAKLEDFIRWYSPVDWTESTDEDAQKTYKLSARMSAPGNIWQELWEHSKPIPAYKQKRLFDDTNEGFKVLTYLETRNLSEVYQLTVVPLLHSSILKLKNIFSNSDTLDIFEQSVNETLADLCRLSRDIESVKIKDSVIDSFPNIEPILMQIEKLELQFYQFKCFESLVSTPTTIKMNKVKTYFKEMMENNGCYNIREYDGKLSEQTGSSQTLFDILSSGFEQKLNQEPISKEYVIRLGNDFTDTNGRTELSDMPQFLRGIVAGVFCCRLREFGLCLRSNTNNQIFLIITFYFYYKCDRSCDRSKFKYDITVPHILIRINLLLVMISATNTLITACAVLIKRRDEHIN